jgi:hypothetical protein
MTRPNKLEGSSLETLTSQVLEFEGKARANPIGAAFNASFLGKLLVLPANVSLDWKVNARYKHSSFLASLSATKETSFITLTPGVSVIKLFTSVIYKNLKCLLLNNLSGVA